MNTVFMMTSRRQSSSIKGSISRSLALVFSLAIVGDLFADAVQIPVPGAAIGMILLTGLFVLRGGPDASTMLLFDSTASHLPLFFVPAAVGIVASAELLSQAWLHIATAVVLGTAVTIAATGLVAQALLGHRSEVPTT